ncbi:MAG TPA: mandelate racemase/muconate lactonizing enzyme family protein [Chloroflexota bacterium]|jgi:L-alanine-DL-glutamate epimerase-like enolase superfamily enzyme|nr:mandelate racemase/muconate lactonizing enzyme family protein [Chloroflexota bacterium]
MRITRVEYVKVFVPWQPSFREPMRHWRAAAGTTPEEEDAYVVVKVYTDDGLIGIGEGNRDLAATRRQGERLLGQNPLELDPWRLERPWVHVCFDLMGKALGVPVYRLLGTKVHQRIPMAYWSPYEAPAQTARHAAEGAARGFKVHKIKARPWDAVEQVKAIHDAAGPQVAVRIDPNGTFEQPAVAVRIARQIEEYNVECLEDPVPKTRPEWNRFIREKTTVPVALHDFEVQNVLRHIKAEAIDYLNVGGSVGLTVERAMRAAHLAEAAGVPIWLQLEGHCYDIQAAFNLHLNAVIPNATLAQDTLPFLREASIITEPLWPTDGFVAVPEKPGLGIELDEAALTRYRLA